MATIGELVSRTYEHLEHNDVFWPRVEVITNGLNPASRLLALQDKTLVTRRTAIALAVDECFYDLRQDSTAGLVRLQRVVVGDDTSGTPVDSQGRFYRLRSTRVSALKARRQWLLERRAYPTHYARYGISWLMIYPRPLLAHTITLIYRALPAVLGSGNESLNTSVDIPESWTSLLPEIAAALLILKEGAGETTKAVQMLSRVLGPERSAALSKAVKQSNRTPSYRTREVA